MDLLTEVGQATKKRETYFQLAESLARKVKTREKLEELMGKDSHTLVRALRDKEIRLEEYARSLTDKTLTSALVAVYLGSGSSSPRTKMEQAWPTVIGDILPPLVKFLDETKSNIDTGVLMLGDSTLDFADLPVEDSSFDPEYDLESLEPFNNNSLLAARKQGVTWPGLFSRVKRYTVNPAYSFYSLGEQLKHVAQGYKEMRRVAVIDGRTCLDCKNFAGEGWQPMGSLPMPGRQCMCYDRCRCRVEYR